MGYAERFSVEVVYALPLEQHRIRLRVAAGTTVARAIAQSGLLARFPEIDPANARLGIHSRRVTPDTVVHAGDRIEIYRPLVADPKTARRARAAQRRK